MRYLLLTVLAFGVPHAIMPASEAEAPKVQQIRAWDQAVARKFIRESRIQIGRNPLTESRVQELVSIAGACAKYVNKRITQTPWDRGHRITTQEVLLVISSANVFKNWVAQQSWEKKPNLGYMDIRVETAWYALSELGVEEIRGIPIPHGDRPYITKESLKAYRADKAFQKELHTLLIYDLYVNLITGSWILIRSKNLAGGELTSTVARYTMGSASHRKRLREEPETRGLSKIAWQFHTRWVGWRTLWETLAQKSIG